METQQTLVKDLRPGSKNLCMVLIVLDIGKPSTTKDGHEVRTIRVADKSGSINLSIWDEPGTLVQSGDILRINKVSIQMSSEILWGHLYNAKFV